MLVAASCVRALLVAALLCSGCGRDPQAPPTACPNGRDGVALFFKHSPASLFIVLENRGRDELRIPFSVGDRWPKNLSVSAGAPIARPQTGPGTLARVAYPPSMDLPPAQSALVHVQCPACTADQARWTLALPITGDDAKLVCMYSIATTELARVARPTHVPRFTSERQLAPSASGREPPGVFEHGYANEGLLAFLAALSSEDQRAVVNAQLAETAPGPFRRFLTVLAAHASDASAQREVDAALRSTDAAIRAEALNALAFATFRLGASDWLCGLASLDALKDAEALGAQIERKCSDRDLRKAPVQE